MPTVIAIDGPAGAGKSSVSRRVAVELGLEYVDTGAMYRALGLLVARSPDPQAALADAGALARSAQLVTTWDPTSGRFGIHLNGEDLTEAVRTPLAADWASRVAAIPEVRRVLVELQRAKAARCGVVMEGRDIGTMVFPTASFKFFFDADESVRAGRRQSEQRAEPALEVARQLAERDRRDRERTAAPLRSADDAICIDTTALDLEAVVARVLAVVRGQC